VQFTNQQEMECLLRREAALVGRDAGARPRRLPRPAPIISAARRARISPSSVKKGRLGSASRSSAARLCKLLEPSYGWRENSVGSSGAGAQVWLRAGERRLERSRLGMRAARACPHARKARPATVALACISFCGLNRDKSPMNQRTGRPFLQSPQKTAWPRKAPRSPILGLNPNRPAAPHGPLQEAHETCVVIQRITTNQPHETRTCTLAVQGATAALWYVTTGQVKRRNVSLPPREGSHDQSGLRTRNHGHDADMDVDANVERRRALR